MKVVMKNMKTQNYRVMVQTSAIIALIVIVTVYKLYINEILSFKILSIRDMNPYGGWNALNEYAVDSGYVFEGISRSVALTIALLTTAILGGRFFCGWLCPLGALQDFVAWMGSKFRTPRCKNPNNKKFNPLFLKYPFLLFILIASILGYGAIIAGLSPWRAMLSLFDLGTSWSEMKQGFIILSLTLIASIFLSRFFCRYLCPLGAAQVLFSSFSLLSLKHSKGCSDCNVCLRECPVGIGFSSESDAISPECIRCLDCVAECKVHKDNRVNIGIRNKRVPWKAYTVLILFLFFILWLGLPKLWGGNLGGEGIRLGQLRDGTYQGEAKGFAKKIITEVKITGGKIEEIKIIEHGESKGWYEEVFMVLPREIIKRQRVRVDGISGATKTSRGLFKSVENAIKKAE
jgi:hypothetical protein